MRRLLGCGIAMVAVALCVVAPVSAAGKPEITHVREAGVNVEFSAELSEFCGFEVVVFEDVRATERDYADGSERTR
jgi:hypothetical protein